MLTRARQLWQRTEGQALVEFAIVVPLLLFLVMGTVEIGRIAHAYLVVVSASREGARSGALGHDDATIEAAVRRAAVSLGSEVTITVSPGATERWRGDPLEVDVDYSVDMIMPVISTLLPNPFPVHAATVMRME